MLSGAVRSEAPDLPGGPAGDGGAVTPGPLGSKETQQNMNKQTN
jgi:hypothetical protein